jgi:elongation factor Ts
MSATAEQIKKLRELTGAGVLDSKRTLEEHDGDFDKALAVLKEKSLKSAAKKSERVVKEGLVETYVHTGGRVGVMVEINCETDFVARTPEFQTLAHDIALQIAATKPLFVTDADIPAATLDEQKKIFSDAALADGKPANIVEKIVQGKLESYLKEACLLKQPFIRDESTTIQDLIQAMIAKLGENIVVRRFVRFELGD